MSWFLCSLLLFLSVEETFLTLADSKSNVHIIYMGRRQHDDTELITKTHHEMLGAVLGSKEATEDSMIYSYKHGFSGFAAKLTESQAKILSELPDVVQVIPNRLYKLRTTRSWDYLGLSSHSPTNLLQETNMGDGAIIGILDTGIWPESEAFNDRDLGEIPSRWKGFCESGDSFDPKKNCNKKLIGARFFIKGLEAEQGHPYNTTKYREYYSPRDSIGHGTHTSATAAGSFVANASYNGLARGTARGGAPRARLAMYKVCWKLGGGICSHADLMKGFDEAIHDGVDVLSLSIGSGVPLFTEVDERDGVQFGAFHAVERGISVVCAAGNSGPISQTVENTAPWVLTVAASSVDRLFPTPIVLGNNLTLVGQAMFMGKDTGFRSLMYPEVPDIVNTRYCQDLLPTDTSMAGKVVLCFTLDVTEIGMALAELAVLEAGGVGLIVARNPSNALYSCTQKFPCVEVSYEIGTQILRYIRSTRDPKVRLRPSKSYVGKPVSTNVAYFSSRGPSSLAPAVLKPDIAAPGVKILAAVPPLGPETKGGFRLYSGTSMATPHVSGIVALLKSLHSDWSPAAIKSAIITTAWTTDPSGEPIFAEGDPIKLADPFDFGGGIVNANKARQPGLVYDMGIEDYIHYLCAMGYNSTSINKLIKHTTFCPRRSTSILDVNFPSITVPSLKNSVTLTRTVTNVGPVNSKYQAVIESPPGILIAVKPDILTFDSNVKKVSFTVMISTSHRVNTGYGFGSLTWTDRVHFVRSPISVKTEIAEYYID